MVSVLTSRRVAATVAGAVLLSLSAACGGSADAAMCADAKKAMTGFQTDMAGAGLDLKNMTAVAEKHAANLKAMAAKADGDLASALNDLSASLGALKLDADDPEASAAATHDFSKKVMEANAKLTTTCS
ncbi:hypothetical protein [Streptosporangium pseudovulgare]|uniref:Uncharacterized protein n=1 Tax=Streptosporangium pseudovulgare TaxID=35765 RepID=A0ABQ2QXU1_9ACTN|nr:hypothetical protein [Streptosporangium pseudovulgare]GGP99158.1 hypothetical protein GCM10010140_31450 [Streptosporangium pseudovulgare]